MRLYGIAKFFGLDGTDSRAAEPTPDLPRRLLPLALSCVLALAVFFLFRWLLEDAGGFAVYVPYLAACSTLLTSALLLANSRLATAAERKATDER